MQTLYYQDKRSNLERLKDLQVKLGIKLMPEEKENKNKKQ